MSSTLARVDVRHTVLSVWKLETMLVIRRSSIARTKFIIMSFVLSVCLRLYFDPVEKELEEHAEREKQKLIPPANQLELMDEPSKDEETPAPIPLSEMTTFAKLVAHAEASRGLPEGDGAWNGKRRKVNDAGTLLLDEWFVYKRMSVTAEAVEEAGGPLGWWATKVEAFPHLIPFARKYLAIQASSAASERLFSVAGSTITAKRNRLTGEHASDIIFLHECMKLNIW